MEKTIWVIDDDPIFRMIVSHNLKYISPYITVVEYDSLVGLVQIIEAGGAMKVDLPEYIFLDINLPEIDAWVFLEKLTSDQHFSKLSTAKIIVVSSSINPYDKTRAMTCSQVMAFESKPLSKDRIVKLLGL